MIIFTGAIGHYNETILYASTLDPDTFSNLLKYFSYYAEDQNKLVSYFADTTFDKKYSFEFIIYRKNHLTGEWVYSSNGGIIFNKDNNTWGIHT